MSDKSSLLYDDELDTFIESNFTKSLFRLETLDHYDTDDEREEYFQYCAGEPGPDLTSRQPWLDHLRGEAERGLFTRRVHIVTGPLTDYLRYECEWGYAYGVKEAEEVRILDLSEVDQPEDLLFEDFWLIDDEHLVLMHYDEKGIFLHGEVAPTESVDRYRLARDAAWDAATPFEDYWSSHPHYWRVNHKP